MFTRFNGNVVPFADDATLTNRTVFGGTTQSDDINDNLNADFKKGWEIVGLNDNPTREDFNAMGYTLGALISYLYEMGISEWNTSQNYRINSRVIGSDGKIYRALTGTTGTPNVDNDPISDAVNWEFEFKNFVDLVNNQEIDGIKEFIESPIVPTPTIGGHAVNKDYVDNLKTIASGTATFTATTNNINLTGIGLGVEIGDVIQISGADDSKNNSEFTIEVITDANNVIVNQAHANKGSVKNVANRASDTGVTVKLLSKWYNTYLGLGQDWVNVTANRTIGTTYPNNTNRSIKVKYRAATTSSTNSISLVVNGNTIDSVGQSSVGVSLIVGDVITKGSTYSLASTNTSVISIYELR